MLFVIPFEVMRFVPGVEMILQNRASANEFAAEIAKRAEARSGMSPLNRL